jgi:hypothetical protein
MLCIGLLRGDLRRGPMRFQSPAEPNAYHQVLYAAQNYMPHRRSEQRICLIASTSSISFGSNPSPCPCAESAYSPSIAISACTFRHLNRRCQKRKSMPCELVHIASWAGWCAGAAIVLMRQSLRRQIEGSGGRELSVSRRTEPSCLSSEINACGCEGNLLH